MSVKATQFWQPLIDLQIFDERKTEQMKKFS